MEQNKILENRYYNSEDNFVVVSFSMLYMEQVMPAGRRGKRRWSGIKTYQPGDSGIYMSNDPMLASLISEGICTIDQEQTENERRINKEAQIRNTERMKAKRNKKQAEDKGNEVENV